MKPIALVAGVIGAALGGLWLLQGLGVVHVRPILCFADCAPVQGSSLPWAIIGLILVTAAVFMISFSLKPRPR